MFAVPILFRCAGIAMLFYLSLSITTGARGNTIQELIRQLGNEQFTKREDAVKALIQLSLKETESGKTIDALLAAESHTDPEIQMRATLTMWLIYLRIEAGKGAPKHGISFKSKLMSIQKKLRVCPMVADIENGSVAGKSNLQKGDIILGINGTRFDGEDGTTELTKFLNQQREGSVLSIEFYRKTDGGRETSTTTFTLGEASKVEILPHDKEIEVFRLWLSRLRSEKEAPSE